ncbi:hypothetical protein, partial [Sphingobacterium deserti]|uniref:hypothetical protein n=1 Tax=Sphingobacterium deserti TaxID=1229276 RepID=UPI00055F1D07
LPYKSICLAAACGGKVEHWTICLLNRNLNLLQHAAERFERGTNCFINNNMNLLRHAAEGMRAGQSVSITSL